MMLYFEQVVSPFLSSLGVSQSVVVYTHTIAIEEIEKSLLSAAQKLVEKQKH